MLAANREMVTADNRWNQALRRGVSTVLQNAFGIIVTSNDPLKCEWMHFIPRAMHQLGGFWAELQSDVEMFLRRDALVLSYGNRVTQLSAVRELPSWFINESGPLLSDNNQDLYISPEYQAAEIKLLRGIGLTSLGNYEILARLKFNLPRIHETPLDDIWHTNLVKCIEILWDDKRVREDVKQLAIIPLHDGSWTSASSAEFVHLPFIIDEDSVQIELPNTLGFRKVHPMAFADGQRRRLFTIFGISACSPHKAIETIIIAQKTRNRKGHVDDFVTESEILFWFGDVSESIMLRLAFSKTNMRLVDDRNIFRRPSSLFFKSQVDYHAEQLLANTSAASLTSFGIGILNLWYSKAKVQSKISNGVNWWQWLENCGVSYIPPLIQQTLTGFTLSPAMQLIAKDNSSKFVANLRAHWLTYHVDAEKVIKDLKEVPVPLQNGKLLSLDATVLPTQHLLAKSSDLRVKNELPFLALPSSADSSTPEPWFFLRRFGVICDANTAFYTATIRLLITCVDENLSLICAKVYAGITESIKHGEAAEIQVL